jgi:hypothetical protein
LQDGGFVARARAKVEDRRSSRQQPGDSCSDLCV